MERYIDLHIHSTASDGSFTPREIADIAINTKLKAFSITDHDTIAAQSEVIEYVRDKKDIEYITGVEVSTVFSPGMIHILGYNIDIENEELTAKLEYFRGGRGNRNEQIIGKLNELGMNIKFDEVLEIAGDGVPGRPHIARLLLEKGYVKSIQEAFEKYLKKGAAAYFDRAKLEPVETIKLILKAGGIPVLAHPYQTGLAGEKLIYLIKELVDEGLKGIEVWYSSHSEELIRLYKMIADKFNLISTGGTDFHGQSKPDIKIGTGFGSLKIPYSAFEKLKESAYDRQRV